MLKRSPQPLAWTRTGDPVPPLSKLLRWSSDAEDPYGRYCRDEKLLSALIANAAAV